MPWKACTMSEARAAFVALVRSRTATVADACRRFAISRKTGYQWLARATADPDATLGDRPRAPHTSPGRTPADLEARILQVRSEYGWGGRKIRAYRRGQGLELPSARTAQQVLRRHGCGRRPGREADAAVQRFERASANELWQLDFKGPVEVARRRLPVLTVLDDHSRYLLALEPCPDQTMASAWSVLWAVFGEVGLPEAVLSDGGFAARGPGAGGVGLSWFDVQLIRVGVRPLHGRPYHPQTQGKVERLHGTLEAEVWPRVNRDDEAAFRAELRRWRVGAYNAVRPHEALGDVPPAGRWQPSARPRPATLPAVAYPPGAAVRKVMQRGEVSWRGQEILVGAGLSGAWVRVEEAGGEVVVW